MPPMNSSHGVSSRDGKTTAAVDPPPLTVLSDGDRTPTAAPAYWRSLEHLVGSPALREQLASEFPGLCDAIEKYDRRSFLRLLGASLALAGIGSAGCRRWPVEEIRPYTSRPAGTTPGVPEFYATLFEHDGIATGILAKSFDGRPIKIEGNPDHPSSLGAACAFAQASILDLYDPDRSRHIQQRIAASDEAPSAADFDVSVLGTQAGHSGRVQRTWEEFEASARALFDAHRSRQGEGLAILVPPTSSPTLRRLMNECKQSMPKVRCFAYQPVHQDAAWAGARAAFGRPLRCQYDLAKAKRIVCFDADLLGSHPAHLRLSRDWASGRTSADQGTMNRLISIESDWTLTGSVADVRIPLSPSRIELAVRWLAMRLGVLSEVRPELDDATLRRLDAVADDVRQQASASLVAGGPSLSPAAHQWIHAINDRLGSAGVCVHYTPEPMAEDAPDGCVASIRQLSELLQGNVLQTLVILGGNPVYDAPADATLNLESTPARPLVSMHLSLHDNETSRACTWHIPAAHALETWNDGLAWDGTYTLGQPLILPLFDGKSPLELLALIAGKPALGAMSLVRETFSQRFPEAGAKGWELALHDGMHKGSQFEVVPATKPTLPALPWPDASAEPEEKTAGRFEVRFVPDAKVHDGRYANNAWLQELPEPISKLTWDNAAWISKSDADRLALSTGDVIRITNNNVSNASIEIPVLILPGHAAGCLTLPLGYGRAQAGRIGDGVGVNVYPIRPCEEAYVAKVCAVAKTGRRRDLATTQLHHLVDLPAELALHDRLGARNEPGRLIHEALLSDYLRDPHSVHGDDHAVHAAPLFDPPSSFDAPHRWGMAIDLNLCLGCGGCVVACQAENNIPVVGRDNVASNREMHWLRIDRYFKGDVNEPDILHVPMTCAHCENAPCEQVCPVAATVHDAEGLNAMIYNRCIGTRYCANNCPFKVRRFNYFDFHATDPREPAKPWLGVPDRQSVEDVSTFKKMLHNPDVTVRMRGVMEKCTYCVQRIASARIAAKNQHAAGKRDSDLVRDGEVQTACQATCPTRAIVFGDLNDPNSRASQARRNPRSYAMLAELNLGNRTTYLAKIRNRDA